MIRDLESGGRTIADSFKYYDVDNDGFITAKDFVEGLKGLGGKFSGREGEGTTTNKGDEGSACCAESDPCKGPAEALENEKDHVDTFSSSNSKISIPSPTSSPSSDVVSAASCEELVAMFDANGDGRVSLLDFYRFMGRNSPPLIPIHHAVGGGEAEASSSANDNSQDVVVGGGDLGVTDDSLKGPETMSSLTLPPSVSCAEENEYGGFSGSLPPRDAGDVAAAGGGKEEEGFF